MNGYSNIYALLRQEMIKNYPQIHQSIKDMEDSIGIMFIPIEEKNNGGS